MDHRTGRKRILVVDDEGDVRDSICALLEAHGYATVASADGRSALRQMERARPDLVLTDLFMPELDGIELITILHEAAPEIPIVAISTPTRPFTVDYIDIATKLGAFAGLYKPLDEDRLLEVLDCALSGAAVPAAAARVA
ncbi:MAG TPA: response regulator [Dongiaceae bacterium]|jgi:CheY-like chemotaxis protein|nr:response regulator [Dongiaceae bacterium]